MRSADDRFFTNHIRVQDDKSITVTTPIMVANFQLGEMEFHATKSHMAHLELVELSVTRLSPKATNYQVRKVLQRTASVLLRNAMDYAIALGHRFPETATP